MVVEAWQGVFHLSETAGVWTVLFGGIESCFDYLARRKPRSIKQLKGLADTVRFNGLLIKQMSASSGRAFLAARLRQHLIEGDYVRWQSMCLTIPAGPIRLCYSEKMKSSQVTIPN